MMVVFAYFGPETTLPIASGILAVAGFLMVAGRNSLSYVGRKVRRLFGRPGAARRPAGSRAIARNPAASTDSLRSRGPEGN